jgi:hypothetical protein
VGIGLLALLGATAAFGALYHIPDIDAYFLVGLPAVVIGWLMLPPVFRSGRPWGALLLAAILCFDLLVFYPALDKSGDRAPLDYGAAIMDALPPDAVVVTQGDNDVYALWYQQMVLGQRGDVAIVGGNFLFQGWYAKHLEHADRSAVPVRVTPRPPAQYKAIWDAALVHNAIAPVLREGRPLFMTSLDPLLADFFKVTPVMPPLLTRDYIEWFAANRLNTLPSEGLYRVEARESRLLEMDEATLEKEFIGWYVRRQHDSES